MTDMLTGHRCWHTQRKDNVKIHGERLCGWAGAIHYKPRNTEDCQRTPEARRNKEVLFLRAIKKREREREAVLILNPRLPALQLLGNKSIIASCPVLATLGK